MKKKLIAFVILIAAIFIYFTLYYRDKELKFVPRNADVLILMDTKKATRQYISSFLSHPSEWINDKNKDRNTVSLLESGLKIPDFLQIFHLQNTGFSDWYSILELKNKQKFLAYLQQEKFVDKGNGLFHKGHVFIKIEGANCILGTSDSAFENINRLFLAFSQRTNFTSDTFIDGSLGSISVISNGKIRNFSIDVNADDIEIKTPAGTSDFTSIISKVQQKTPFFTAELDRGNIKNFASFFDKNFSGSAGIDYLKAAAELEQVNDTIITYGYDDDFNEIEKKTIRKITQPNYSISLQSSDPEKTEQYFENKKWINVQHQFTAIPFQPNVIERQKSGFEIKSTKKTVRSSNQLNENYIFIRNNELLFSNLKLLTSKEKKAISDIDYIFYGNKGRNYYVKLKVKENNLPLILRW
ncbi:hypothetical protein [Flavobacterium sp. B17]|uniref:hypothetical protein n=1 Tax=Flavobacterium sp. B17 TaxID=95618 RepID=UPI001FCBE8D8|nr:hypothetical protein [Flavobacterium sp. B17]